MRRRLFLSTLTLLTVLLAFPTFAQPAQHPARRYLVRGTLQAISATSVTVKGHDRHEGDEVTKTLKIDPSSQVQEGLKVGDQVVADYNHTMENNVFKLVSVRKAGANTRGNRRR